MHVKMAFYSLSLCNLYTLSFSIRKDVPSESVKTHKEDLNAFFTTSLRKWSYILDPAAVHSKGTYPNSVLFLNRYVTLTSKMERQAVLLSRLVLLWSLLTLSESRLG